MHCIHQLLYVLAATAALAPTHTVTHAADPAAIVNPAVSAFNVTTPPPVVPIALFTAIVPAFRFTPAAAVVLTAPLSVVVPLPAVCTRLAADSVVAVARKEPNSNFTFFKHILASLV